MVNGVTQLVMTKIDVLNDFDTIEYADNYIVEGKTTSQIPHNYADSEITIKYKAAKGWNESLTNYDAFDKMPIALQNYVNEIEKITETKITMISTGPNRDE